jgi:hypothetical protein
MTKLSSRGGMAYENNNSVGLNTVNLQTALDEVFHVHS